MCFISSLVRNTIEKAQLNEILQFINNKYYNDNLNNSISSQHSTLNTELELKYNRAYHTHKLVDRY